MDPPRGDRAPIWTAPLYSLFDLLSVDDPPRRSDCIFAFAGRPERKRHGIELWHRGFAPTLLLSVGRFEWRRFPELELPEDGGLKRMAEETTPPERHFFVTVTRQGISCDRVHVGPFGTRSEARALAAYARRAGLRSILVVSTRVHLRRAALIVGRSLRGSGVETAYTAVPEERSSIRRREWWRAPATRRLVSLEFLKYLYYWIRLRP